MNKAKTYFFLLSFAIVAQSLLWPVLITNDGTTYISSGHHLFSELELTHYYWIREPLYPLFLRLLSIDTPLGIFALKAIQTIFIYGSIFLIFELTAKFFQINIKIFHTITLFIIITLTFNYSIYASIVLQQALLTVIGALFTLLIFLALNTISVKKLLVIIAFYLFLVFISVNLIVFFEYIPILLAPIFAWSFAQLKFKNHITKKYISFILFSIFLALAPYFFSQPWQIYKQNVLNPELKSSALLASAPANQPDPVQPNPTQPVPSNLDSDIVVVPENFRTTQFPDPLTVLNNYRGETKHNFLEFFQFQEDPYIKNENELFVMTLNEKRDGCTFIISSKWYPFYDFTEDLVAKSCLFPNLKTNNVTSLVNLLVPYNSKIYSFLANIFIFVFFTLIILGGPKFAIYFIYPITFASAYIFTANTIDRYTIPMFPFYLSFAVIVLILIFQKIKPKIV